MTTIDALTVRPSLQQPSTVGLTSLQVRGSVCLSARVERVLR